MFKLKHKLEDLKYDDFSGYGNDVISSELEKEYKKEKSKIIKEVCSGFIKIHDNPLVFKETKKIKVRISKCELDSIQAKIDYIVLTKSHDFKNIKIKKIKEFLFRKSLYEFEIYDSTINIKLFEDMLYPYLENKNISNIDSKNKKRSSLKQVVDSKTFELNKFIISNNDSSCKFSNEMVQKAANSILEHADIYPKDIVLEAVKKISLFGNKKRKNRTKKFSMKLIEL